MAGIKFKIDTYKAAIYHKRPSNNPTVQSPSNRFGQIDCFGQKGRIKYVLHIMFGAPMNELPQNGFKELSPMHKVGTIWLTPDLYPVCLDLLRNEKPVYGWIYANEPSPFDPSQNMILTGDETIGEGE